MSKKYLNRKEIIEKYGKELKEGVIKIEELNTLKENGEISTTEIEDIMLFLHNSPILKGKTLYEAKQLARKYFYYLIQVMLEFERKELMDSKPLKVEEPIVENSKSKKIKDTPKKVKKEKKDRKSLIFEKSNKEKYDDFLDYLFTGNKNGKLSSEWIEYLQTLPTPENWISEYKTEMILKSPDKISKKSLYIPKTKIDIYPDDNTNFSSLADKKNDPTSSNFIIEDPSWIF